MKHLCKNIFILLFFFPQVGFASESSMNLTVFVEIKNEVIIYKIENIQTPYENLLDHFNRLILDRGRDTPITIIFDNKLPLKVISDLKMIIGKAGFLNVQQFTFSPETQKMVEIVIKGPAVPIPKD
jgi:hypothetical protein